MKDTPIVHTKTGATVPRLIVVSKDEGNLATVFAKTLTGKIIACQFSRKTTVADFKLQIQSKEGLPADDQRLIFKGMLMEDSRALVSYGVTKVKKLSPAY